MYSTLGIAITECLLIAACKISLMRPINSECTCCFAVFKTKFWCAVKRNNQNSSWWLVGHKWMKQNSLRGIFKYLVYLLCIMRRNMCKQYCISYTFSSFFCLWDHWGILNMHFYFWTQSEFLSLLLGWYFLCVWWYIFVCCVSIRITTNRRIDFEKNDISEIFSLALTTKFFNFYLLSFESMEWKTRISVIQGFCWGIEWNVLHESK